MILLVVFALGSMVSCWIWSDASVRTKGILTLLYAATWGFLYTPFHRLYLVPLAQCMFTLAFGGLTFGVDWLMKDIWRGPR